MNCFSELPKFAALHPNIIVHVENVVRLFSSASTSSQKVRKCGGHKFLYQAIECGQLVSSSLLDRILVNCFSELPKFAALHPNIIVYVENLFSSPSTSSQKVQKCGGHKFLSQAIECGQLVSSSLLDRILVNCFSELPKFAALHPNIIVYVENVVSLFSSPFTSSQKVRKCGGHKFLSQAIWSLLHCLTEYL